MKLCFKLDLVKLVYGMLLFVVDGITGKLVIKIFRHRHNHGSTLTFAALSDHRENTSMIKNLISFSVKRRWKDLFVVKAYTTQNLLT